MCENSPLKTKLRKGEKNKKLYTEYRSFNREKVSEAEITTSPESVAFAELASGFSLTFLIQVGVPLIGVATKLPCWYK